MSDTAKWYIIHTYSGYEKKVATSIENAVENRKLQDLIQEVRVPVEKATEIKNDKKREVERKLYPSYVFVKMIMTDDSWYVVRNIRGVTGFVGPGSKPVPLSEEEMRPLGIRGGEITLDFELGDAVIVTSGAWEGTVGNIKGINEGKQSVTINVDMFGRETPVELNFTEVKKM